MENFKKTQTAKKGLDCLLINNSAVVLSKGEYKIYDAESTNTTGLEVEFDELPYITAYEAYLKAIADKKQAEIDKEVARIADIKERILNCSSPIELANEFCLESIETAGHWSDLYEGRSFYAIKINSRADEEILLMAADLLDIEGEIKEAKNRAGEHHSTLEGYYSGIEEYSERSKTWFYEKYNFRNQESEEACYIDSIKEMDNMEDIIEAAKEYQNFEAGFYDSNGSLEISESAFDGDFTGYSYDVYTYQLVYSFEHKHTFKKVEEEEEVEE